MISCSRRDNPYFEAMVDHGAISGYLASNESWTLFVCVNASVYTRNYLWVRRGRSTERGYNNDKVK
jgi:hypothetical protein